MKAKKLLARLRHFLDADAKTQMEMTQSTQNVLKALKEKERKLQLKLEQETDPEKADEIKNKLEVIYAQRKKGVTKLRQLR